MVYLFDDLSREGYSVGKSQSWNVDDDWTGILVYVNLKMTFLGNGRYQYTYSWIAQRC